MTKPDGEHEPVEYCYQANNKKPEAERKHVAKARGCLKCKMNFKSTWSDNRICKPCSEINSGAGGMDG